MQDEHGTWRQIPWREWFPWLLLLRTFRLAIDFRKLFVAALALASTALGWALFAQLLDGEEHLPPRTILSVPLASADVDSTHVVPSPADTVRDWPLTNPVVIAWWQLTSPFLRLFDHQLELSDFTYLLLCSLWAVAVWALAGAIITRIAAHELALEERSSLRTALAFTRERWVSYFWAPLFPLVGILLVVVCMSLLGWLLRFDFGLLLMGIIWPLYLLAGLFMVIVLVGLLFGWPLMWATISVEGTDMFDALSRTYSYVYQRPLHYVFYVVVAALYGLLGWLLVSGAAAAIIYLSFWGASWTAGEQRTNDLLTAVPTGFVYWEHASGDLLANDDEPFGSLGRAGVQLLSFWTGCVVVLALGFVYSYFWTAATAIYLLMRRQTDATEMDEIFTSDDEERHALPPLKADAAGVPLVDPAEPAAPSPPATDPTATSESPPSDSDEPTD